ncbi:MAG: TolC family protein [Nitrospirales bacterium]|nr:TolC family protein [Nitrospira sp.]MDR4503106.1 TolC family protein [Nitrospirales bacterium]
MWNLINRLTALSLIVLLIVQAGCVVTPERLTESDIQARITHDLQYVTKDQDPVTDPIDIFEAMARALAYNLETKVEVMKTMLAHQQLDLSHYDLLPQLVLNSGYDGRSNYSGATSRSLLSGQTSLEPSTSSQKNVFTTDLSLSWDVLDFGLSYVRAKQAANNVLIAEEERRRVANRVMQHVRTTFWRTVSANRMLGRLALLEDWVTKALDELEQAQQRRLEPPLASLQYQRELLSTKNEIQKLYHALSVSRFELAELMNLTPGQTYELTLASREDPIPTLALSVKELEHRALVHRPELRTIDYRKRINAEETKAALLDMLPNLNLQFGPNYSSNSFLFNNHWLSYGAKISWNLLNVFRTPKQFTIIELQDQILHTQSLALTMTVMSQVHVSLAQLTAAKTALHSARAYFDTQEHIEELVQHSWNARRQGQRTIIRERLNGILAELRHEAARAEYETAYANLLAAIGEELLPERIEGRKISEIANALRNQWDGLKTSNQETA